MQSLQGVRSEVRLSRSKGFTLIEMMVVVAILTIVATIAFAGIRQDRFEGTYRMFTEDSASMITRARHLAIDNQTQTRLDIEKDKITLFWQRPLDPYWDGQNPNPNGTLQWEATREIDRDKFDGGILANNDAVCIYGIYRGIVVNDGAGDVAPTSCLGNQQQLLFFPDGHMEWVGTNLDGSGISLVIGDRRTPARPLLTQIQVFPGGLIRKFDTVRE